MKRWISLLLALLMITAFMAFAVGSSSEGTDADQGTDSATVEKGNTNLGDYSVVIDSCRLAEDYEGKAVAIIKYIYTNNSDTATSFMVAFDDAVYQEGLGLNPSYVVADSAKYNADEQMKEIQKGTSLEVEVAYELNDTKTDLNVEVKELISLSDKKITKTFTIAK